ncbi:MAG: carboxymuconolactone decarboxylase family protein [Bryobacterales bacterium]|nr:carboxymuconolactone decarboxylase family protein [Bryobacterales bacterium]
MTYSPRPASPSASPSAGAAARYTGAMPLSVPFADPAANEFLASLESRSGRPNHFFRTMAHRPEVLKSFVPLYGAIMGPGVVERRTKELVYLTCSFANQCAYCLSAHLASGRKAGVTEDEMTAIREARNEGFSPSEQAAISYARELTRSANGQTSGDGLPAHFSAEQIVEITLIAAMANFTNRFNNGLGVMPE